MPHYDPSPDRYESMPYRRCGRSGLLLPALSLGLWHNFGDDRPLEVQRAILRRAFDLGITHFDLANNYGPPYGSAETNFGSVLPHRLRRPARRADHLDQGRLGHVARPLRRPRLAQVPAGQPGPEPRPAGPRLRRHLLPPPLRPRHPPRRDHGRARRGRAPGQGALRRHLLVLRRAHPRGDRDPALAGHAAAHPPAVVLHVQPLDRGPAARRPRRGGRRVHRVLAAGPGTAHRPLPARHPRRVAAHGGVVAVAATW